MIAVETVDLVKEYEVDGVKTPALRGVTFKIEKGEFTSIIGPSGSGKSTLLNLVGTLDRPTSGKVLIDQIDTSKLSGGELAKLRNNKVGFVFQSFNLIRRMKVLMNVELPLLVKGIPRTECRMKAMKWLGEMGIEDKANRRPSQLSGGEQQRVAVARALVTDPSILLGDEPTGNLDTRTSTLIVEILRQLNKTTGKTFVIITHDLEVAEKTRRIIKIRDGLIEEDKRL